MIIGLIGLIGSGKSTAGNYIKSCGFEVINLDVLSHSVYKKNSDPYHEIIEIWGKEILCKNSEINRSILSKIIFSNPENNKPLANLEAIVWPRLELLLDDLLSSFEDDAIVFIEGAQIVKSGFIKYCDILWCVISSIENINKRLEIKNDKKADLFKRLKFQIEEYAKITNIDEFIHNDSTKQDLNNNVQFLLERLRKEI